MEIRTSLDFADTLASTPVQKTTYTSRYAPTTMSTPKDDDDTGWTLIGGPETEVLEEELEDNPRSASSSPASGSQQTPSLTTQAAVDSVRATPTSNPNQSQKQNEADESAVRSSSPNADAHDSIDFDHSDWVLFLERLRSFDPITQLLVLAEALGKVEEALVVALANKQ